VEIRQRIVWINDPQHDYNLLVFLLRLPVKAAANERYSLQCRLMLLRARNLIHMLSLDQMRGGADHIIISIYQPFVLPEKLGPLPSESHSTRRLPGQIKIEVPALHVVARHLDLVAVAGEELPKDLVYVAILGDERQHGGDQITRKDEAAKAWQRAG
jgi:hypothetical protein